ncbi:MAG: ABC transporter permease [Clostridia bacterium]
MSIRDLIRLCLQNLLRRKSRTFLTVTGVVVGACAIIIMISIGVGMKETQEKLLSEMGDLTIISVMPAGHGSTAAKLNAQAVQSLAALDHVVLVTPRMMPESLNFKIYAGRDRRYVCPWGTLVGMDEKSLEQLGYRLLDGEFPDKKGNTVLVGQNFAYGFQDTKRPENANMIDLYASYDYETGGFANPPDPYFDIFKAPLQIEITVGNEGKTYTQRLNVVGRMKEDYGKGGETSDGILMRLADLKRMVEMANREAGLKTERNPVYQSVLVKVADIGSVAAVESEIMRLGFNTNSMESIRQPMEKDARQKQMMLGGMGAISLLVAALGIMNTMIMSISERTREIGVMKALGCFVHDVRTLFLMEAGVIGLMGGIIGVVLSYIISISMNLVTAATPIASFQDAITVLSTKGARMSVIPLWLTGFSLIFSIMIGLGSGYYPANKAVGIPALEAIKHD